MKRLLTGLTCVLIASFIVGCCKVTSGKHSSTSEKKRCEHNMILMSGAIEFYNEKNAQKLKDNNIDEGLFRDSGVMVKSGFLKEGIQKPTNECKYHFGGDFSSRNGGVISCEKHGSLDNTKK